jgi:DAK2 domain fusion protein YloV
MTTLTAEAASAMVKAAHARIVARRDEINALNVFPVPDADTGTNLAMTLEAAARAAETVTAGQGAGSALLTISRATILGARGNSGVIFSQYLRGLARSLGAADGGGPDGATMARALAAGADGAYGAVDNPVEGTILTVARRAAQAAAAAAPDGDVAAVLRAAAREAEAAVADTTAQLPELAAAGVVDSAGLGLFHILDAMAEVVEGSRHALRPMGVGPADAAVVAPLEEAGYGYEVQFVLEGEGLDAAGLRAALRRLGESLVVAGDDLLLKVHIHAPDPEAVLRAARTFGRPESVSIDNLDSQTMALHQAAETGAGEGTG